ncbi:DUF389 domain-containing protein [Sphingomonas sp. MAHUQ-71]|uniref:DUF389 domain-containing protein n=2 Tax=Sphingomonas oryzagri TaxID=3042314 RepID=A0ABT6MZG8_9SPHN|nr:DUF389 domain-containing protein [Sphingomonas oryzagri]MDH7637893.1 DUF389 domain-containing protein [Sphingomonas oryzagri]
MNEAGIDTVAPAEGWRRLPLYRWWRMRLVGSVDHAAVIAEIVEDSGWSPRYAFMILMSAGIAVLGLLLSSPAVVIGAMLISPLMSPILGLGFSLTLFDFAEMRRSLTALVIGSVIAVLFTALVVLASPLKAPTAEILARTRPNLFDLLVALFAALAGTFSIIRGKGATITGVAIATALMPPLAVVGFGLATWNLPVLGGAFALFLTNFVTIALSATIMARFYGFGHRMTAQQTWMHSAVLLLVFVAMAIPLGISLSRIAREAYTATQVRSFLTDRYGARARVTQLDIDFDADPIVVRGVVIAPRAAVQAAGNVRAGLAEKIGRPVNLQLDQVALDPGTSALDAQKVELAKAQEAQQAEAQSRSVARLVGLAAGISPDDVVIDRDHQKAIAHDAPLPGAELSTYRAIEQRAQALADGWSVEIVPPLGDLPLIRFADGADTLDGPAKDAAAVSIWAARRWHIAALAVPGLPEQVPAHPSLVERRALAIKAMLDAASIRAVPGRGGGGAYRLQPSQPMD